MRKILCVSVFIVLALGSCTDIIDTEEGDSSAILVVEADINNIDESYFVKLSTTSSLDGLGSNDLGVGADVVIRNTSGEEFTLNEISPGGLYSSANTGLTGIIGESYQLYIRLSNGEEYESEFEEIPEPVELLDAFAEVRAEPVDGLFENRFFHDISLEVNNNRSKDEFFSVDITGIAEVSISYDEIIGLADNPCIPAVIQPSVCYAIRDSIKNDIVIGNNVGVGTESLTLDVLAIPADFKLRYLAQLRANSISEEAHQYLTNIKSQLEREGSIFDSPLPALVGNVKNIRTNNRAQGYFFASGVSENQVCFDRSMLNFQFSVPLICAVRGTSSCIEFWNPATFEMPEGFQLCF